MRIGIGLNLLAPDNGGVTNYALTLLRHWPDHAPDHPMVLLSFAHNEALLATLPAASRRHEIRLKTQEEALDHLDAFDLYFCPFGTLWPRPMRKPTVLTFHDMQERFYPDFFTPKEKIERFFHYDWSLRMADSVVTISDFTRASAVRIAGIPSRKCHVVHHVPDELPPPARPAAWTAADDARPFVVYPANFWKHKNHLKLIAGFAHARAQGLDLSLVCTGSLLGRDADWREAVAAAGLADRARHLGMVSRAEISWLFHHARALVFPSLFEGFGIPLLEAMAAGCPIACGNNTSQPEVAGDAALYFNAENPKSIAAAISRIVSDDPLRAKVIAAGRRRLQAFTVDKLVAGHLGAFRAARRRHGPFRAWINDRWRLPRSMEERSEFTDSERQAASKLLRERTAVPTGASTASL